MPSDREGITRSLAVADMQCELTMGFYPCGCLGEIFIRTGKDGELVRGLLDGFATMFSIGLQYGAPPVVLLQKCLHTNFGPNGFTGDPACYNARSILDYVCSVISHTIYESASPVLAEIKASYDRDRHLLGVGTVGVPQDPSPGA